VKPTMRRRLRWMWRQVVTIRSDAEAAGRRRLACVVVPVVALLSAMTGMELTSVAPAGAAATSGYVEAYGYTGNAFGTSVTAGRTVTSGKTSLCSVGCTTKVGALAFNALAGVSASPLLSSATVATRAATAAISGGSRVKASSTVQGVSLLGGLIEATTVEAVSTTKETGTGTANRKVSASGSRFAGLEVLGVSISATPRPSTNISLPGIGDVVLNQRRLIAGGTGLRVTMIDVSVTQANGLGYPIGARIIVAEATTQIHNPVIAVLRGGAYATSVQGKLVKSGATAPAGLSCFSSSRDTNTTLTVSVPGVLTSGTVTDSAVGTVKARSVNGTAQSSLQSVNLLAGLLTASAVTSDATAHDDRGSITTSGSATFVDLAVAGHPGIPSSPRANTKIAVPGVGTLWLNRISQSATGIRVEAVELLVTHSNTLGLAVGTVVRIAVASAGVTIASA
jgi:hypothetical protein